MFHLTFLTFNKELSRAKMLFLTIISGNFCMSITGSSQKKCKRINGTGTYVFDVNWYLYTVQDMSLYVSTYRSCTGYRIRLIQTENTFTLFASVSELYTLRCGSGSRSVSCSIGSGSAFSMRIQEFSHIAGQCG